jgi:flagellin-like protein
MKHMRLIRKDERAVSPVIATILMVAITVVLAAVLYVMVSGLIAGPGGGPRAMGINAVSAGTNWSVEFIDVPTGLVPATTYLLVRDSSGGLQLARTTFASLDWTGEQVVFQDANPGESEIKAGDSLLMSKSQYPSGSRIEISDDLGSLASRTLQG